MGINVKIPDELAAKALGLGIEEFGQELLAQLPEASRESLLFRKRKLKFVPCWRR
jgi:hypothetical protein